MAEEIELVAWRCCDINGLGIVPSLCGERHEFVYKGLNFELRLPRSPKKGEDYFSELKPISCSHWRLRGNRRIPASYDVHEVDIYLNWGRKAKIPSGSLGKYDANLFTAQQKNRYDSLVKQSEELILEAFEHWKLFLRWKTRLSYISPSFTAAPNPSRQTYLADKHTKRRFYAGGGEITIMVGAPITKVQWKKVQKALVENEHPPIWEQFYIEADHRLRAHDYHGAIISLAIAIESSMRTLVQVHIKEPRNAEFEKMIGRIGLSQLIDSWKKLGFSSRRWERSIDKSKIKRIVETRNRIMHKGDFEEVTSESVWASKNAVRKFLDTVEADLYALK